MTVTPSILLQSQSQDATYAYLVDNTVYDASTQLATNVVSSVIQVTFPNSPLLFPQAPINYNNDTYAQGTPPKKEAPITTVLTATSTTTAISFAKGTAALVLNDTTLTVGSRLANGVYAYSYAITFADGTTATGLGNFLLIGTAEVILDAKIGALALLDLHDTNPDDETVESLFKLFIVLNAATNIYKAGDMVGAQKICEWIDIRCNTLDLGSMIANYGQLTSVNL